MADINSKRVTLNDKTFELSIPYTQIDKAIDKVAKQINADYRNVECPLFLGVLNGAFMFMADLIKRVEVNCEVTFVKIASYEGTCSSGTMKDLIGLKGDIEGRHVIIVEDIVDTGCSIVHTKELLEKHNPASIEVATLLFKPESYRMDVPIKYRAMDIPNDFIVGFGLDYNELGRNLNDIYKIVNE